MSSLRKYPGSSIGIVGFLIASLLTSSARAQSGATNYGARTVRQQLAQTNSSFYSSSSIEQRLLNRATYRDRNPINPRPTLGSYTPPSNRTSKPFSSLDRGPSVTPYLALNNSFNQVSDYYNIVRPQQQQRRFNQQQQRVNQQLQRQNIANQRRLTELTIQGPYGIRGDEDSAPTGHPAVFQSLGTYLNTGNYYPEPSSNR